MSAPGAWAPADLDGPALLERAVGYTRGSLRLVGAVDPRTPTPCAGWDLLTLLQHMDDSLAAFTEAADVGYVDLVPVRDETGSLPRADALAARLLVDRLRQRACALLAAWAHHPGDRTLQVADRDVRSGVLAAAGSLEIAVHGWDVARACGEDRPVPSRLALELLEVLPLVVAPDDRPARFGVPVEVPRHAGPGTRLLAALGRADG